jgi:hypothetical protein
MFEQNKWWNSLDPQTKEYLKKQPIWNDKDLYKATAFGIVIGFLVGVVVGYEWAWRPVVQTVKPLVG